MYVDVCRISRENMIKSVFDTTIKLQHGSWAKNC